MNKRHLLKTSLALACAATLASLAAQAAVSADEAAKLRTTLTPLGAERAGNKEGTIPAWEGGLTRAPAGYKNGDPRPDPFPGDKPVLTINARNMDQHAAKLSDGVKALMKKYPDFKIEGYPRAAPPRRRSTCTTTPSATPRAPSWWTTARVSKARSAAFRFRFPRTATKPS